MWARVVAGAAVSAALSEPSGSGWQEVADTPKPPRHPNHDVGAGRGGVQRRPGGELESARQDRS